MSICYVWFVLSFPRVSPVGLLLNMLLYLLYVLYLLVKATSTEYTLPLEKIVLIFAVSWVSVGIHHRDLNWLWTYLSFTLALGNLWCVLHGSLQMPSSTMLADNTYHKDKIWHLTWNSSLRSQDKGLDRFHVLLAVWWWLLYSALVVVPWGFGLSALL